MAEIGVPVRRRVLVPETVPAEPNPYTQPAPEPAKVVPAEPEKVE